MTNLMPAETAEWIRANAWTGTMRETFREVPGFYLACACQSGLTTQCRNGKHGRCRRATPATASETVVCSSAGDVMNFRKRYRHISTTITGRFRMWTAEVWLADRVCRWVCPCECHFAGKQLDLFALVGDRRG